MDNPRGGNRWLREERCNYNYPLEVTAIVEDHKL